MTLRTTPDVDAALAELASAQGVSKNEAVLRAILSEHGRLRRTQRLATLSEEARSEWAETLDRLGTV